MNKKIIVSVAFVGLLCAVSLVSAATIEDPLGGATISSLLAKIVAAIGAVIASLGTIMLIVSGIIFLTSAGNPGRVETAKKALTYAIIGIAIGISASAIVQFVTTTLKS